ncbi:MAG TPA: hypothetical protein VE268_01835 [Herpetosiphonaceae bacterium]|nr:hypothetical protein [Herpetosiphonaceae bacterium]
MRVEVADKTPDLVVDQAQHTAVVRAIAPPVGIIVGPLLYDEPLQPDPLAPFRLCRLRTGDPIRNRHFGKEAEIRFRHLIGIVGLGKRQPEKKGLLRIALLQAGYGIAHNPIWKLTFKWKRRRFQVDLMAPGPQPGVEGALLRSFRRVEFPEVHVEGLAVEVAGLEVAVILARHVDGIAPGTQNRDEILGPVDVLGGAVLAHMRRLGKAPGKGARARGHTDRHGSVGVLKAGAAGPECLGKRHGVKRKAFTLKEVCPLLIRHHQDDIGSIIHRRYRCARRVGVVPSAPSPSLPPFSSAHRLSWLCWA